MDQADTLTWATAWELRDRIAAREVSSEEVVTASVARINALDPRLRAFITVASTAAIEEARRADAVVGRGLPLGPLHGVPIALKDEIWTAGIRSTGGSLLYEGFVPAADGIVARRVRQAGAIIVGKSNMPEFAAWPRSVNRIAGESVNPWDIRRTSGASSGGSAAALATGMVPIAVGSDGGGSIRIPAALCGVVGLHPTTGRVPSEDSFSYSPFASIGPMARDVRDVATLFSVLAGYHPGDPTSSKKPVPDVLADLDAGVDGLRVGFTSDYGFIPLEEGIADAVRRSLHRLESLGARIEELDLRLRHVASTFFGLRRGYARFGRGPLPFTMSRQFDEFRRQPGNVERLCPYSRSMLDVVPFTRAAYEAALEHRDVLQETFDDLFARYDVIVTPTVHVTAPLVPSGWGTPYADRWMGTPFTSVVNLLGLTAASYPAGFVRGLPVGLQVIGEAWAEATVLRVCRSLEVVNASIARQTFDGMEEGSAPLGDDR